MAVVLAIEPDLRQAAILKRIVKEKVKADLVVVDSRDAAMEAIGRGVPDVLLLSALMSPRDEDELIRHLRSLDHADHLQTHTIPQLSSSLEDPAPSRARGLLKVFRRKKEPDAPSAGCDPDLFADEIRTFVKYAAEKKEERRAVVESGRLAADAAARANAPIPDAAAATLSSSWSDPFAWNPSPAPATVVEEPAAVEPAPAVEEPPAAEAHVAAPVEPVAPDPIVATAPEPEPLLTAVLEAEPVVAPVPEAEPLVAQMASEADPWATDYRPAGGPLELEVYQPAAVVAAEPVIVAESTPDSQPPTLNALLPTIEELEVEEPVPVVSAEPVIVAVAEAQASVPRSLGPLATWVRFEVTAPKGAPQTTNDELQELMAHLAIPPHVAGVSYARGCRIRRVRVRGGRERRKGDVAGPVILSRRQLAAEREVSS